MSFLMENWQNLELAAIRMGFGEGLVDIAKKNNLVVALSADLMESVGFGKFYEENRGNRGQLKLAWRSRIWLPWRLDWRLWEIFRLRPVMRRLVRVAIGSRFERLFV